MGKRKNESLIFTVHSGKERCREGGGGLPVELPHYHGLLNCVSASFQLRKHMGRNNVVV